MALDEFSSDKQIVQQIVIIIKVPFSNSNKVETTEPTPIKFDDKIKEVVEFHFPQK